jgi:hypothetical protein
MLSFAIHVSWTWLVTYTHAYLAWQSFDFTGVRIIKWEKILVTKMKTAVKRREIMEKFERDELK